MGPLPILSTEASAAGPMAQLMIQHPHLVLTDFVGADGFLFLIDPGMFRISTHNHHITGPKGISPFVPQPLPPLSLARSEKCALTARSTTRSTKGGSKPCSSIHLD